MIDFKALSFHDYPILKKYFTQYPQIACDYNLSNLYTWGEYYTIQYTIIRDRLFLYNPVYSLLFFPVGKYFPIDELCEVYHEFLNLNKDTELILIPKDYIDAYPEIHQYCKLIPNLEWSDYVYSIDKLIHMPGKKLAKKKNLVSQFKKLYPEYSVERIHQVHQNEILDFCNQWRENKNQLDVETEFKAIERTFQFWEEIESKGLMLKVNDKLVAFSIFSPQNQTMLTEHFEKYDFEVKGAAQMIVYEMAKFAAENGYLLINREQDMNLEGLRQAKRSYDPLFMVEFYRISNSMSNSNFILAQ